MLRSVTLSLNGNDMPLPGDAEVCLENAICSLVEQYLDEDPNGEIVVHIDPKGKNSA